MKRRWSISQIFDATERRMLDAAIGCKLCRDDYWVTDKTPCPQCNADGAKEFPTGEEG